MVMVALLCVGCSEPTLSPTDGGGGGDGGADGAIGPACPLAANTSATAVTSPSSCAVLSRDTSSCQAQRASDGLSGFWLKLSCRVTLSVAATTITATSDGQPDYTSNYFAKTHACWENYTSAVQNPNTIAQKNHVLQFPRTPDTATQKMTGAIVGLALNGVPIFGNFAAPGDDIFREAMTFDRCGAHPQMAGTYHYHSEPYSISYDDDRFVGVMRDGYPIYGRKDSDGSLPTLDTAGGHTSVTPDSPGNAVYHYHVNEQTSTTAGTAGQKQWFLTTGTYHGTPAACAACN
jgi:hypothetical protein